MNEQPKHSKKDLAIFRALIIEKLEKARSELASIEESLSSTTDNLAKSKLKSSEDTVEVEEQENLNFLALRTRKHIKSLEAALVRLDNGTYGICVVTGKLISKDRLLAVPHATMSFEAKQNRRYSSYFSTR